MFGALATLCLAASPDLCANGAACLKQGAELDARLKAQAQKEGQGDEYPATADLSELVKIFERGCMLRSTQACARAINFFDRAFVPVDTCGNAEVCYRLGRSSCAPPCEGTEVNLGNALLAHRRGCEFAEKRSCIEALKLADWMEPGYRRGHAFPPCAPLTEQVEWKAWPLKTLRAELRATSLSQLCRDGWRYCNGFVAPCIGLRARGSASELGALRAELKTACDGAPDAAQQGYACRALGLLGQ